MRLSNTVAHSRSQPSPSFLGGRHVCPLLVRTASSTVPVTFCRRQSVVLAQAAASPFAPSTNGTAPVSKPAGEAPQAPYSSHTWRWRGHKINYVTAGCGDPILLVHGFGASVGHFRKNIPELAKTHKVYAVDLLGFGASAKPAIPFSLELWRDMLLDFRAEFIGEARPLTLIGNSMGSLVALMVNAASPPGSIKGTVLLNAAGAMNNKGVVGDWRIVAVYPLLLLIDFLLSIPALSAWLFNKFRSRENLKQVLSQIYVRPEAVDDALIELLYGPSNDPGAREVFVSVVTGPPGPKPWKVMPDVQGPLLVLWGDKDVFTPADGPVGQYLQSLPQSRPETSFVMLPGAGHCLHDDQPEEVHAVLLPWLAQRGAAPCEVVASAASTADAAGAAVAVAAVLEGARQLDNSVEGEPARDGEPPVVADVAAA